MAENKTNSVETQESKAQKKTLGQKTWKVVKYTAAAAALIFIGSRYGHKNGLETLKCDFGRGTNACRNGWNRVTGGKKSEAPAAVAQNLNPEGGRRENRDRHHYNNNRANN